MGGRDYLELGGDSVNHKRKKKAVFDRQEVSTKGEGRKERGKRADDCRVAG